MSSDVTQLTYFTTPEYPHQGSTSTPSVLSSGYFTPSPTANARVSHSAISIAQSFHSAVDNQGLPMNGFRVDAHDAVNTHDHVYTSNNHATQSVLNAETSNHSTDQPNHVPNTYHIHLHLYGDTYHGPIYGGNVGGRSNSYVRDSSPSLVSDIDTIVQIIRSYGQTSAEHLVSPTS
ncbi:hypothetical protein ONZ45_g12299 [Pleurotus djamor]|nr:hypothetical protein ONZ45_g12299 [Pleurotus djamor]